MAKAKSKKITIEEALVPVDEQPYQIPDNWCWVYGKSIFNDMETKKPSGDTFRYIDIDSIDNVNQRVTEPKITETAKAPSRASRKLHAGDTVFSMVRPYLKNIAYISEDLSNCIASTGFYICTPKEIIDSKYLYQLMISPYVVDGLNMFMKGDNSPSVRKDDIEGFVYPLPPLSEQKRIVEQIESLFAKLNEAKSKVEDALEEYTNNKAAIMHAAFKGYLTEKWREANNISLDNWQHTTMGKIAKFHQGVQVPVNEQYDSISDDRIRFIRIIDYTQGSEEPRYIAKSKASQDTYVTGSEIVMVRYGASAGFVGDGIEGVIANNMFTITVDKELTEYVKLYLRSPHMYKLLNGSGGSSAMPALNFKVVSQIEIDIPDKVEREQIIKSLIPIIENYEKTESIYENILIQIELMKKSILAKAFRGELGTNNPEEEPAIELLKGVLEA